MPTYNEHFNNRKPKFTKAIKTLGSKITDLSTQNNKK